MVGFLSMKQPKKLTIKQVQDKLWKECRRLADTLYMAQNGSYSCFTCGRAVQGSSKQLGHFLARSVCGAYLKYDMRNLRWQCFHCNINLGGNGAVFYQKLRETEGQLYVDQIMKDKNIICKAMDRYLEQLALYKTM